VRSLVPAVRGSGAAPFEPPGADARVSADNRGHGLGVAMEEYTPSAAEQKQEVVGKLEKMVN
jgi:hypothetical protein